MERPPGVPLTGWALAAMRGRVKPEHQTSVLLHAMRCDPEQALEVGLVDQLLPADEGYAAALAKAEELAQLPPHAYAKTKTALRQSVLDVMQAEL